MRTKSKLYWVRCYTGPFSKTEGEQLAQRLKNDAEPERNMIWDAKIRLRRGTAGAWDVYIKTTRGNRMLMSETRGYAEYPQYMCELGITRDMVAARRYKEKQTV